MSEGSNLWLLNNGTADGQLATKSEIEDRVTSGSNNQYQVIISGDYAANQCVKYSDIKITKVDLPSVNFNCTLIKRDDTYGILTISNCSPSNMSWTVISRYGAMISPNSGSGDNSNITVTVGLSMDGSTFKRVNCTVSGSCSGYKELTKSTNYILLKPNIS